MLARFEAERLPHRLVGRACLIAVGGWQNDVQLRIEVTRRAGRTAGWDAHASQAQPATAGRVLWHRHFHRAIGRGHRDPRAQRGLPRGDRHIDRYVAAVDAKTAMLVKVNLQIEVSCAPVAKASAALAGQPQMLATVDALWNGDVQRP
jgi:hypothetical protein